MKTAKFKVYLTPDLYAVMTISLKVTPDQERKAEAENISKDELDNLLGQELQSTLALLGNSDEA